MVESSSVTNDGPIVPAEPDTVNEVAPSPSDPPTNTSASPSASFSTPTAASSTSTDVVVQDPASIPPSAAPTQRIPEGVDPNDLVALAYGPDVTTEEIELQAGQTLNDIAEQTGVAARHIYEANRNEIERIAIEELHQVTSFAGRHLKAGMKLIVPRAMRRGFEHPEE
jgi:hypothetical protein